MRQSEALADAGRAIPDPDASAAHAERRLHLIYVVDSMLGVGEGPLGMMGGEERGVPAAPFHGAQFAWTSGSNAFTFVGVVRPALLFPCLCRRCASHVCECHVCAFPVCAFHGCVFHACALCRPPQRINQSGTGACDPRHKEFPPTLLGALKPLIQVRRPRLRASLPGPQTVDS